MGLLRFGHISSGSFVGSNAASQVVFIFLLIPCCFTKDYRATPLLPNISFLWAWNAPTHPCPKKFNVSIDLSLFSFIGNPAKDAIDQPVILFYVDRLGLYPHIDKHGNKEHGGVPQLGNLKAHLAKATQDISLYMPTDKPGLAIIDWEEWRPIWARNWKPKDVYRDESILVVQQQNVSLNISVATAVAKEEFERAGKNFMVETLKLGIKLRPEHLWGYYLFPDCYNHHYTKPNYNGTCFDLEKKRNDELNWMWTESTALYPSIYLNTILSSSPLAAPFVRNRVKEAIRVSVVRDGKNPLPIYIYARPVFTDQSSNYLNQEDLMHTLGETISLGASGLILWGSLNLSQSSGFIFYRFDPFVSKQEERCHMNTGELELNFFSDGYGNTSDATCTKLHDYLNTILNPYIINITLAAKMCSQVFCMEKGFCTRKDADSSDYLHLNPMHLTIERDPYGKFKIKGNPSVEDLQQFADNFHCSCYSNMDCENEVNLTKKIFIDVCMIEDICIKTVLNSKHEIFHSSPNLVLFLLFLLFLKNEYSGIQTRL